MRLWDAQHCGQDSISNDCVNIAAVEDLAERATLDMIFRHMGSDPPTGARGCISQFCSDFRRGNFLLGLTCVTGDNVATYLGSMIFIEEFWLWECDLQHTL